MDRRLTAWLDDTLEIELKLARPWLQVQVSRKLEGRDPEPDYVWGSLYRDSGSYIDIRITPTQDDQQLQVIQLSPLILSDGARQIEATFSNAARCSDIPTTPPALYSIVPVHNCILRWTSYGPPSRKLRLILPTVHLPQTLHSEVIGEPTPIHTSDVLESICIALSSLRSKADSRFAPEDTLPEDILPATSNMPLAGRAGSGVDPDNLESSLEHSESQWGTQFGTQPTSLLRHRVLHEQTDPRERAASSKAAGDATPSLANPNVVAHARDLLSLLNSNKPLGNGRHLNRQAVPARPSSSQPPLAQQPKATQSMDITHDQAANGSQVNHNVPTRSVSPGTPSKRNEVLDQEATPAIETIHAQVAPGEIAEVVTYDVDIGASETAWMAGWTFNASSAEVSEDQARLLDMPQAWLKPEPGYTYPAGNIPIEVFNEIAYQIDAAKTNNDVDTSETSSDSDMDEDNGSSQITDDVVLPDNTIELEELQDDLPTSSIPWSSSPVPEEAPMRPPPPDLGLPPDSSFEAAAPTFHNNADHDRLTPTPSTHPGFDRPASGEMQPPGSSPPLLEMNDLDADDDDMELVLPRGLGEDFTSNTSYPEARAQPGSPSRMAPITLKSTVQVVDTPNVKGKSEKAASPFKPLSLSKDPTSSREPKNPLSTSIVFGTYQELTSSGVAGTKVKAASSQLSAKQQVTSSSIPITDGDISMEDAPDTIEQEDEILVTVAGGSRASGSPEEQLAASKESVKMGKSEASPASAQLQSFLVSASQASQPSRMNSPINPREMDEAHMNPSVDSTDCGESNLKRKPAESPSRQHSRQYKKKFIKIRPLGDGIAQPVSRDPTTSFREERRFEMNRIRESRQGILDAVSSLSPSSGKTHLRGDRDKIDVEDRMDLDDQQDQATPHKDIDSDISVRSRSTSSRTVPPIQSTDTAQLTTLHNETGDNRSIEAMPISDSPGSPETVMSRFKHEYPMYTGDLRHFINLCIQMYEFEIEDKMVPKWQWDDYLIRNRTDYVAYVTEHMNAGEDARTLLSYHRFYKDNIRNTLHTKGIISDTSTLITALEELGHDPEDTSQSRGGSRQLHSDIPNAKIWSNSQQVQTTRLKQEKTRRSLPTAASKTHTTPITERIKPRPSPSAKDNQNTPSASDQLRATRSDRGKRHALPWQKDRQSTQLGSGKARQSLTRASLQAHGSLFLDQNEHSRRSKQNHGVSPRLQAARQHHQTLKSDPVHIREPSEVSEGSENAFRDFSAGFEKLTCWTGSRKERDRTEWPASVAARPSILRNYTSDFLIFDNKRC